MNNSEDDRQVEQLAEHRRQREDQAGEVDLAEHGRVARQALNGLAQRVREIRPDHHAAEGEQRVGDAVGLDADQSAEDDREDHGVDHRLDDRPAEPQRRLSVTGLEISPGPVGEQVAVIVDLFEIDGSPARP